VKKLKKIEVVSSIIINSNIVLISESCMYDDN
jgi:hypothetical protein